VNVAAEELEHVTSDLPQGMVKSSDELSVENSVINESSGRWPPPLSKSLDRDENPEVLSLSTNNNTTRERKKSLKKEKKLRKRLKKEQEKNQNLEE
jgi:hypothetical protein